jgi:TM2 domain-containing membrane protein YozV
MSEKLAERTAPRPTTTGESSGPSTGSAERALVQQPLSASERAERELAKIDEEMDAILDRNPNREALMNRPDQALQPPQGRQVTPAVSQGVDGKAVNHLAMNVFVPGLGTMVRGHYARGLMQLGLFLASIPTLFMGRWALAVIIAIVAYLWSLISGIRFLSSSAQSTSTWK